MKKALIVVLVFFLCGGVMLAIAPFMKGFNEVIEERANNVLEPSANVHVEANQQKSGGDGASDSSINVQEKYGSECKIAERCDDMLYVDCGAAVDGPAYYLDSTLEIIGTSGGVCIQGCSGAPEEWTQCIKLGSDTTPDPTY